MELRNILYVYCRKLMILNLYNREFLYSFLDFILLKGERVGKSFVFVYCFYINDI